MLESRSVVYRSSSREGAEQAYHAEARQMAAQGFVPTSEEWSAALGQQVLTVQYAHLPEQAPAVLAALASLEIGHAAPAPPQPPTFPDAAPPSGRPTGWVPPAPVAPAPVAPTPTTSSSNSARQGRGIYAVVAGLILLAIVAAFAFAQGGKNPTTGSNTPTQTPTPRPTNGSIATPRPTVYVPPQTEAPAGGPTEAIVGEPIGITCSGVDCMNVTVVKVAFASVYKDPQGFYNDTPSVKGNVFMAVDFSYKATGPGADYNEFDWNVYVNNTAVSNPAFVENGPKPELSSGDLSVGKSAAGWIVWEVPAKGTVTVEYAPGFNNAIFSVTLRP